MLHEGVSGVSGEKWGSDRVRGEGPSAGLLQPLQLKICMWRGMRMCLVMGMMLGEQGARCCLSMYLYREGEEVVTYLHT
jgi:hypothetical protein